MNALVVPEKQYELRKMCRDLTQIVKAYYADPAHEAEFREWYQKQYGKPYDGDKP